MVRETRERTVNLSKQSYIVSTGSLSAIGSASLSAPLFSLLSYKSAVFTSAPGSGMRIAFVPALVQSRTNTWRS